MRSKDKMRDRLVRDNENGPKLCQACHLGAKFFFFFLILNKVLLYICVIKTCHIDQGQWKRVQTMPDASFGPQISFFLYFSMYNRLFTKYIYFGFFVNGPGSTLAQPLDSVHTILIVFLCSFYFNSKILTPEELGHAVQSSGPLAQVQRQCSDYVLLRCRLVHTLIVIQIFIVVHVDRDQQMKERSRGAATKPLALATPGPQMQCHGVCRRWYRDGPRHIAISYKNNFHKWNS